MNHDKTITVFNKEMKQNKESITGKKCCECEIGILHTPYEGGESAIENQLMDKDNVAGMAFYNFCPECGTKLNLKIHHSIPIIKGRIHKYYFTHEEPNNES